MWDLDNKTPYCAERAVLQDRHGADVWVVLLRGTFVIQPGGELELAPRQVPVCMAPEYTGEPGRSSLRHDGDLVLSKGTTDVLLLGSAHAPGGGPATEVRVDLQVGPLSKSLLVLGDRRFGAGADGPVAGSPRPFRSMPVSYERAHGGVQDGRIVPGCAGEPANPIGVGFATDPQDLAGRPAPNVLYPDRRERPAGFGPIPRDWSPRREYAGTYDTAWRRRRQPLLPLDFDERFYQCAPADQQPRSFFVGGEPVQLRNLTPGGGLEFVLPAVQPTFITTIDRQRVEHRGRLHTVLIEPDELRLQLVWHSSLACHGKTHLIRSTRVAV